jgi:uncharacterized cupin superfamily protein
VKSTVFGVAAAEVQPLPTAPERLEGGAETFLSVDWQRDDTSEVCGVWVMTPGVLHGVDGDEMFVVVSGRATLEFPDGRVWDVGPGDAGVLVRGDPHRWTVHETIRKAYSKKF